jgi:hypothetical protein
VLLQGEVHSKQAVVLLHVGIGGNFRAFELRLLEAQDLAVGNTLGVAVVEVIAFVPLT